MKGRGKVRFGRNESRKGVPSSPSSGALGDPGPCTQGRRKILVGDKVGVGGASPPAGLQCLQCSKLQHVFATWNSCCHAVCFFSSVSCCSTNTPVADSVHDVKPSSSVLFRILHQLPIVQPAPLYKSVRIPPRLIYGIFYLYS